jgi:hypothetical protein
MVADLVNFLIVLACFVVHFDGLVGLVVVDFVGYFADY